MFWRDEYMPPETGSPQRGSLERPGGCSSFALTAARGGRDAGTTKARSLVGGKKVMIVLGSPRARGNSARLALRVADGVRKAGGTPHSSAPKNRPHVPGCRPLLVGGGERTAFVSGQLPVHESACRGDGLRERERGQRRACAAGPMCVGPAYRCTLPAPDPPTRAWTSARVSRGRSPGMECFRQDAATANSSASCGEDRLLRP